MKRLIHLISIILILFTINNTNAGWDLGLGNFIFGYKDDIRYAAEKAHEVLEHGRRIINQGDAIAEKHLNHIDRLEERTVNDLKEISKDVDSKIERINSMMKILVADINEIEKDFFSDLKKIIWETECGMDRIMNQSFQDALGKIGLIIGTNTIRIFPPAIHPEEENKKYCFAGTCLVDNEAYKDFKIKAPFFALTYDSIKEYLLDRLNDIGPDTPIDSILLTYSVLSKLSKRALCCWHNDMDRLVEDHIFFKDKLIQLQKFTKRYGGYDDYEKENESGFWDNDLNFRDEL